LYPDVAEHLGVVKRGGAVARVLRAVALRALRQQDEVVAVGRCMREQLIARGVDARALEVIPNWSPVEPAPDDAVARMRRDLGWGDELVAMYSGNFGLAHDFTTLVEAAARLPERGVRMVFAGEGAQGFKLRTVLADAPHVSFATPRRREELAAFLGAADVHFVTMRAELAGLVVPSKFYGIIGAGRPAVYVGPGGTEVAREIEESGSGMVFRNRDAGGLADALAGMASGRGRVAEMAARAREAAPRYSFARALAKWREILGV
jgi:glycosyltransferase involved in cell wall biosynthesis